MTTAGIRGKSTKRRGRGRSRSIRMWAPLGTRGGRARGRRQMSRGLWGVKDVEGK